MIRPVHGPIAAVAALALIAGAHAAIADTEVEEPPEDGTVSSERWARDSVLTEDLAVYRANYLLPVAWSPDDVDGEKSTETQFQISLQQKLFRTNLVFTYTQTAFWQLYNGENSRPFRDINHNPQLFYRLEGRHNPFGAFDVDAGYDHLSNGRSEPESRSLDRLFVRPTVTTRNWRVGLKLWSRLEVGTDNPDITDFYGNHQLEIDWQFRGRDRLSLMTRYNPATGKGAARLRYTTPAADDFFWFVQVFDGYGESLIDYNRRRARVAVGIAVSR